MSARDLPIVLAGQRDAPAIAMMSRDLIEAGLGWEYRRERIARMIRDSDTVGIVTREGARVAGFAFMTYAQERGHLVLLAVRPPHQRAGVAHRMLEWLTRTATVAGVASLHVELRVTNLSAFAFYRREGYAETVRVPGYYRGREACVRMIRLLRNPTLPLPEWQPPTLDGRTR